MARRRGQRVGYLKQYGPSWIGQWREDFLVDGKIKRVKVSTTIARCKGLGAVSKREAQRIFWETVLSKLDTFSTRPQTMATLAEFIRRKYQPECVAVRKTSGRASVESVLANHILPGLGSLRMRDIGHVEVSEFLLSRLRVGLAPKTVGNMRGLLAAIFSHAKRRDYYSGELPTAYVRLPEMTPRRRRGSLTFAEARTLAEALAPADRALVLLLAITGPRIGEAMGLRWGRCNLSGDLVSHDGEVIPARSTLLVENYVRGAYGTLKTERANRPLPLPRLLIEALEAHRDSSEWTAPDDPVFAGADGGPAVQSSILRRIKKQTAELGLPRGWSWHWLRRTATSLADQVGMSPVERQKGLGHASQGMTMHYSHADIEQTRAGLERLANRMLTGEAGVVVAFKVKE